MRSLGVLGFKPYYNWNTFNTFEMVTAPFVFNGVLNLIITGIPSILYINIILLLKKYSFKPYYNWNTFNTLITCQFENKVSLCFKPYYNWNTFNTLDLNKNIDFMVDWFTF